MRCDAVGGLVVFLLTFHHDLIPAQPPKEQPKPEVTPVQQVVDTCWEPSEKTKKALPYSDWSITIQESELKGKVVLEVQYSDVSRASYGSTICELKIEGKKVRLIPVPAKLDKKNPHVTEVVARLDAGLLIIENGDYLEGQAGMLVKTSLKGEWKKAAEKK